ncbi:MAG: magnesium chelatase, partial [Flavobacteriales bacterium]
MTKKEALELQKIKNLGALKSSGYKCKSIKAEMRDNLIEQLGTNEELFHGIHGYEETVIPDIQRALLARHNMIFLGLRGQAKTRMARSLVDMLDPVIPVVCGSEILDDPFDPVSTFAKDLIASKG